MNKFEQVTRLTEFLRKTTNISSSLKSVSVISESMQEDRLINIVLRPSSNCSLSDLNQIKEALESNFSDFVFIYESIDTKLELQTIVWENN